MSKTNDAKQALPGHRLNHFGMNPHSLILVGLDTKDGPEHPLYDPRIEDLKKNGRKAVEYLLSGAGSIVEEGFIHFPLVRKNGNDVEVGVGRNRVFAARIILDEGLWTKSEAFEVPVVARKYTDERWRSIVLGENFKRKDSDPVTEAIALSEFAKHVSPARVREVTGLRGPEVEKLLNLVQMPKDVRAAVVRHHLPRAVAMEVGRMNTRDQLHAIEELVGHGLVTVEAARTIADRSLGIATSTPRRFYLPDEVTVTGDGAVLASGPSDAAAPVDAGSVDAANDDDDAPAAPAPAVEAPPAKPEGDVPPPRELLREILAEVDDHGSMVADEALAMLRWSLTGNAGALKAVPKLHGLVKKALKRIEDREAAREAKRAAKLNPSA